MVTEFRQYLMATKEEEMKNRGAHAIIPIDGVGAATRNDLLKIANAASRSAILAPRRRRSQTNSSKC
jgi:hypothetical protein